MTKKDTPTSIHTSNQLITSPSFKQTGARDKELSGESASLCICNILIYNI